MFYCICNFQGEQKFFQSFIEKGLYTLGLAGALAAGIIVTLGIAKISLRKR